MNGSAGAVATGNGPSYIREELRSDPPVLVIVADHEGHVGGVRRLDVGVGFSGEDLCDGRFR